MKDTYFRTYLCLSLAPRSYVNTLSTLHLTTIIPTYFFNPLTIILVNSSFIQQAGELTSMSETTAKLYGTILGRYSYNPEIFLSICMFSVRIPFFLRVGLFCKSYVTTLYFFRSPLNSLSISNRPNFCEFSNKFL